MRPISGRHSMEYWQHAGDMLMSCWDVGNFCSKHMLAPTQKVSNTMFLLLVLLTTYCLLDKYSHQDCIIDPSLWSCTSSIIHYLKLNNVLGSRTECVCSSLLICCGLLFFCQGLLLQIVVLWIELIFSSR